MCVDYIIIGGDIIEEIWKDIFGYEGYYKISNHGKVKSLERDLYRKDGKFHSHKKEKIKTPKTTSDGYKAVTLSVNGKNKTYSVHYLVANAFLEKPNTNEILEINHKDTNRKNNNVENLEWVTHSDNVKHSANLGHYNCHAGKNNGRCVPVSVYDLENNKIKDFDYLVECATWLKSQNSKIRSDNVYQIASHIKQRSKKNLSCYGYIFKTK